MWDRVALLLKRLHELGTRHWVIGALVAVVSLVFQARLADAADWLIDWANFSGLAADVVRTSLTPLAFVIFMFGLVLALAYRDTRSPRDTASNSNLTNASRDESTAQVQAGSLSLSRVRVEFRVVADGETWAVVDEALGRARTGLDGAIGAARNRAPSDGSVASRSTMLSAWGPGRSLLIREGLELAAVLRGLPLRENDTEYSKDLPTAAVFRRSTAWIGDADQFEDYWLGGQILSHGPIRRFVDGFGFQSAPIAKPVWRQRRVRDVEHRVERLRRMTGPDPKATIHDTANDDGTAVPGRGR